MIPVIHILIVSFCAGLISLAVTPVVIALSKKYGFVDDPQKRSHPARVHTGIIPRAGGLVLYFSILVTALLFLKMTPILIGILLGGGAIIVMGLLDDLFDTSPIGRLIASFIIVGFVILCGIGVPYITNPFGGVIHLDQYKWTIELFGSKHSFLFLSNIFSLLWIVAIMNFVSWSSGVDGQLPGFVGISCIFIGLLAFRFSAHEISSETVGVFAFIVAGAFLGFLPWHFYPQKIMPGYSGGALAGFLLGVLSILSWSKIGTVALVLSVPLVDAVYIIIRRIKNGTSPVRADRGHFHHRLMEIGWGKRRIAVFYWLISAIFGSTALYFERQEKLFALGVSALLLAFFISFINRIKDLDIRK